MNAECKPVAAWIVGAFLVGVAIGASAGTAIGFWVGQQLFQRPIKIPLVSGDFAEDRSNHDCAFFIAGSDHGLLHRGHAGADHPPPPRAANGSRPAREGPRRPGCAKRTA